MSQLKTLDDTSFAAAIDQATGLSVVDFGADWCAPCRLVTPVLEELAGSYGQVSVYSFDVDENPAVASRFGIRNLPTVLFFRDGEVVDRIVGALPKPAFQQRFDSLVGA